jgi:predicted RNA-binding protein with PUA-like domain
MKSEPDVYGIDHLERDGVNMWEGCRNYTVRNFMRDSMSIGDRALFYHSNADPSGIVGEMEIVRTGYPDPTQFDPSSEYYDPKAPADGSRWLAVDVKFIQKFSRVIPLAELHTTAGLETMAVLQRGQRLSIMPVTEAEWTRVFEIVRG